MAPFLPLYIRRSDGKIEIKASKNAKSELNEPLPEQLDSKPNEQGVSDFYRQCRSGDAKEIDWRRKLAGMLMREIGAKDNSSRNVILASLPENYRLYEHVKCKASDADGTPAERSTKTHAAGGNERQDAYLYGHPQGRKKRYRSPAEFFPHLLWLATDDAADPNNCSCKFCSPEELDGDDKLGSKNAAKDSKAQALKPATNPIPQAASNPAPPATTANATAAPKPGTQQIRAAESTPAQQPAPGPVQQASSNAETTPLPRPRSQEQFQDSQYSVWMYRLGEIVWFSRGSAWGLGVVAGREVIQQPQKHYHVQPLSHPFDKQRTILLKQSELRPWLAWSPPPCTAKGLNPSPENGHRSLTYGEVDWQRALNGDYGQGDAEVDASILAVKSVELTYTPIDFAPERSDSNESHYNGIYLGGEKMWVGEPLRLRSENPTDIMVLHDIVEKPNSQEPQRPRLSFVGDIFAYRVKEPQDNPSTNDQSLPERLREDLHYRNNISMKHPDPSRKFSYYWRLTQKLATLSASDVKGRWYESGLVSPVLDPAAFEEALHNFNIPDTTLFMNGQGDCNRDPDPRHPERAFMPVQLRKATREEALERSVPVGFKISGGITSAQPRQQQQGYQFQQQQSHPSQSPHHPQQSHLSPDSQQSHLQQQPPMGQAQHMPQNGYGAYMNMDGSQHQNGQQAMQGYPYSSIYENSRMP